MPEKRLKAAEKLGDYFVIKRADLGLVKERLADRRKQEKQRDRRNNAGI
jgi:hypothetical protein